jgi:magnesium transporter
MMTFALPTAPAVEVRDLLERDGPQAVALQLLTLHPVEITEALETLEHDQRLGVVRALPVHIAAQVLLNADSEFRAGLLERLSSEALAQILDRLPVEHATQILEQLDEGRQVEVLAGSSPDDAAQMETIRRCAPSSVGRLMVRQVPRIREDQTVAETFRYLRRVSPDMETINNLYVLDEAGELRGVVALRELVVAEPQERIRDLMQTRVVMVTPDTDREEAAQLISRYNFLALPVVDENRRLLGVLTVDDLVDVLIQENTEDVLSLGAVSGGDPEENTSYWAGQIFSVVKKRIGWLLLLFVAETFTGAVLRQFNGELAKVTALAFFIPLLIGTGGNAGSQTVATIVRGLALGEIRLRDAHRVLVRESSAGLVLGLLLGFFGFVRAILWGQDWRLCATVGVSVIGICTWATIVGSVVPLLARRFRIDPTVVSAPLITTVVDATGLVIYFGIAKMMLGI